MEKSEFSAFSPRAENVAVSASGKLQSNDDALVPVVNADGELLLYNGKPVRKNKDGQLFDSDGNPILTKTGGLLRLNDAGFIVTEDGQIASMDGFSLKNGNKVQQGSFGTLEPLLSEDGFPLTFKGKKLYRKGNRVVDEDGNIVRIIPENEATRDENIVLNDAEFLTKVFLLENRFVEPR